jgi:hypothetical protein
VFLNKSLPKQSLQKGGLRTDRGLKIPNDVKVAAQLGLKLIKGGYLGGTQTGWNRGKQLSSDGVIDVGSLADMRTWFARHGPDAMNGGTSYPGYCQWLLDGSPVKGDSNRYRGAVSWLIWGGDPAYKWLKSKAVRQLIEKEFPNRKKSSTENNLLC